MSLPLSVLTGFLGSGKTTFLNRLLKDPSLEGTLVIVNELGEIGLDHHLMTELDQPFVLLQSGCVCCSLREDLVEGLGKVLRQKDADQGVDIRRVVLETTGVFDPTPLASVFGQHSPLYGMFHLDGVIVTVDSLVGGRQIESRRDVREQIVFADRLVLTKTDVSTPQVIKPLRTELERMNPRAEIVNNDDPRPAQALLSAGFVEPGSGELLQALVATRPLSVSSSGEPDSNGGRGGGHCNSCFVSRGTEASPLRASERRSSEAVARIAFEHHLFHGAT